ncbi:3-phosphoglycerate dehydrogenase [Streptacidiphilus sp. P02-A3a]|nr:3-phosphoglycerate dehydrogenase [Streptacidiphilus sp. P02-A3a]
MVDPIDADATRRLRLFCDVLVRLEPPEAVLPGLLREVDGIVLRRGTLLPETVFASAGRLRLVACAAAGVDHIDLVAARQAGVHVVHVPGESARAVAEFTLGLMLALVRRIALADRRLRGGNWDQQGLLGTQLSGATLGVVGFGHVGSAIGTLAQGLSMRVLATVSRPDPPRRRELRARDVALVDLPTLLRQSDIVVLAVPLTASTRLLITRRELEQMKRHAFLVNVSRGGVVDEVDLAGALLDGTIAGAALDVFANEGKESELLRLDNVVATPHIGAATAEAQRQIGDVVVRSVKSFFAGGRPPV